VRATVSALAVLCGGLPLGAVLSLGLAAPPATAATLTAADAGGSPQACVADAYAAIERHQVIVAIPAACRGLSRAEVNQAASRAIRMSETPGSKPVLRREAIAASRWVRAMFSSPVPASSAPAVSAPPARPPAAGQAGQATQAGQAGRASGLGLGGVGEPAAKLGALLAWLATAASGGWVLARWLRAGGRPLRGTATAAPPAVILGHVGAAGLGLVLWISFMLSGSAALAWTALAILAPVAGLGMGVLLLGLPGPVRPPAGARHSPAGARHSPAGARPPGSRRARVPALAIAGHGMFAVAALFLVLMATIGAG
jgi:manganese efflux pump family protein